MNFTDFLRWLYSVINRVIAWFGDRFSIYVTILDTIDDRISSFVDRVRDYVLTELGNRIQATRNWFITNYNKLVSWVESVKSDLIEFVLQKIIEVRSGLIGNINTVVDFVNDIRSWVTRVTDKIKIEVIDQAKTLINNLLTSGLSPYKPLLDFIGFIKNLAAFFTADTLTKVRYYVKDALPVITAFIKSPMGFILDLSQAYLLDILGWILASSLGSVSDNLDLTPPWKKSK